MGKDCDADIGGSEGHKDKVLKVVRGVQRRRGGSRGLIAAVASPGINLTSFGNHTDGGGSLRVEREKRDGFSSVLEDEGVCEDPVVPGPRDLGRCRKMHIT